MRPWLPFRNATVIALSVAFGAAASAGAPESSLRQAFTAALARVAARQPDLPDPPALQSYAIYDYLVAARLRRDLVAAPGVELDARIEAFVQARAGLPVAFDLRREWLASLAERARWDDFLRLSIGVTDPLLVCDRLAGRLATGATADLEADALARWSLPQRQPGPCENVFAWLRAAGRLPAERVEERARAALTNSDPQFALEILAELAPDRAANLRQWAQILLAPKPMLSALAATPQTAVEPDALIGGLELLARHDAESARALLPRLLARTDLAPIVRGRLQRAVALGGALARAPWASDAFRRLPPDAVDGVVYEWRVRAALWAGNYRQARRWMEQLPATLAATPRWRYWHARATASVVGVKAARTELDALAGLRDYYGYLAADRTGQPYRLNAEASAQNPELQAALAARPALIRAHELFACDQAAAATVEWASVVGGLSAEEKVQAALVAAQWGWHAQSLTSLAQTGQFDDIRLRYPRPYAAAVGLASALTRVPEDWIFAVLREESLFRHDALSPANARGLMQLEPATAVAVARRWHRPLPAADDLFDPDVNLPLGAAHLRDLLDRYDGRLDLALAAYNAGAGAVDRWMPPRPIDPDVWIENIPYGETRGYVEHVLEHVVAFSWTRGVEPPRLATLLCAARCPSASAH